jgi:aldose sugar dehydrogenase
VRDHPDMVNPVIDWTPSLAASGLALVSSDHFPAWQGNLLAGGLRSEQIRRVVCEGWRGRSRRRADARENRTNP